MDKTTFMNELSSLEKVGVTDFCRKYILHGIPFVFEGKEIDFFEFRKQISDHFEIGFHEVFITGSAKLGFSPYKGTPFNYDSDIDVTIVSNSLFERYFSSIYDYQMSLNQRKNSVSDSELNNYHKFLEYMAIGWMRPDKLPYNFRVKKIKTDWFDFFASLSYGQSKVGNYKVSSGLFKSYTFLEGYLSSKIDQVRKKLQMEKGHNDDSNSPLGN